MARVVDIFPGGKYEQFVLPDRQCRGCWWPAKAGASAAIVLAQFIGNDPISVPKGLTLQ